MQKANIHVLTRNVVIAGFLSLHLLSLSTSAQRALAFGGKLGVGITSVQAPNSTDRLSRTAALGGVFLNVQLAPAFALQPEALLSQRGATYTKDGTRTTLKLTYFEVPVLAKFRIPVRDRFFPHFLIGPDFAFNTSSRYTTVDTQTGRTYSYNNGSITSTNVIGVIGGGFDIQVKHFFFTTDARYGYGFNDVGKDAFSVRNIGWSFSAGIGFRLGQGSGL